MIECVGLMHYTMNRRGGHRVVSGGFMPKVLTESNLWVVFIGLILSIFLFGYVGFGPSDMGGWIKTSWNLNFCEC